MKKIKSRVPNIPKRNYVSLFFAFPAPTVKWDTILTYCGV